MVRVSTRSPTGVGRILYRDVDESAANASLTLSTPKRTRTRILFISVKYSSAVTQNITITLNSGAGASWDTLLQTIALSSATDGVWIPDNEFDIMGDDTLDVVAPAGGAGITSALAIYTGVKE